MAIHAAPLPARTPPDSGDCEGVPDWWPYAAEFPDWHTWRGVAGLFYARRPRSSPPKVVRGTTPGELRGQIRLAEDPRSEAVDELRQRQREQAEFDGPLPGG